MTIANGWFKEHEQVTGAVTLVLGVIALNLTRVGGQRLTGFGNELLTGLIKAHHRLLRVIGFLIHVQDIFHTGHELGTHFWNTPFSLLPRLHLVFFSSVRIVSCEIDSVKPSSTTLSANSRNVQRWCPSGAALQAVAITYALAVPSNLCFMQPLV